MTNFRKDLHPGYKATRSHATTEGRLHWIATREGVACYLINSQLQTIVAHVVFMGDESGIVDREACHTAMKAVCEHFGYYTRRNVEDERGWGEEGRTYRRDATNTLAPSSIFRDSPPSDGPKITSGTDGKGDRPNSSTSETGANVKSSVNQCDAECSARADEHGSTKRNTRRRGGDTTRNGRGDNQSRLIPLPGFEDVLNPK